MWKQKEGEKKLGSVGVWGQRVGPHLRHLELLTPAEFSWIINCDFLFQGWMHLSRLPCPGHLFNVSYSSLRLQLQYYSLKEIKENVGKCFILYILITLYIFPT